MRITRIYGKGFGAVGGTSPNVTRLSIFTAAMSVCDPSLEGHASRVGLHAEAVARRLGWTDTALEDLRLGAALHDVGKVNVRSDSSQQAGPARRLRARGGARAIRSRVLADCGSAVARRRTAYVLFHHERWDGGGYPTRRAGTRSRSRAGCSPWPTRSTR